MAKQDATKEANLSSDPICLFFPAPIISCPARLPRKTRDAMRARGHGEAEGKGPSTTRPCTHARTPTPRPAAAWRGPAAGRRRKGTKEAVTRHVACFRNQTHPIEMQLQASRQAAINNAGPIL